MFAVVDCNNFFVSCERVFQPHLQNKPTIVLSNNDGCIIARSNEVKALGIDMGAPIFKYKQLVEEHKINLFSSNFALYGDMSDRVMSTIYSLHKKMDVYSVDEAFLDFSDIPEATRYQHARHIRDTIQKWTGIPTSVGVAPTKTLAKIANEYAKKSTKHNGVVVLQCPQTIKQYLKLTPVKDIWGVGRKYSILLRNNGIFNAYDFTQKHDSWIQCKMNITGLRTAFELRGISCGGLEDNRAPRKSILCSRSFRHSINSKKHIFEALTTFVSRAAEKLRKQNSYTNVLRIFLATKKNYYGNQNDKKGVYLHKTLDLPHPTDSTTQLINYVKILLDEIFCPDYDYKRAGVYLYDLSPNHIHQLNIFSSPSSSVQTTKDTSLMQTLDIINNEWGSDTVKFACTGINRNWKTRREKKSPRFTTRWEEVPSVKI